MAKYNCEIFGVVNYSLEISYHDLHEVEEGVILQLQETLERYGAEHLDFWGYGDSLQFQCALAEYDDQDLHSICEEIAGFLPQDIRGRMVGLDKGLNSLSVYYFTSGKCEYDEYDISGA